MGELKQGKWSDSMPQFVPGESKTALAPIVVKPSGLSCFTELYLVSNGAKVATSGVKAFTSTGAKQNIRFPLTMPAEGAYPVYLDIFTNGLPIGAYQATEDVIILAPKYICPYCGASFMTDIEFNTHILATHPDRVDYIFTLFMATFPPPVTVIDEESIVVPKPSYTDMYIYTAYFASSSLKAPKRLMTPIGAEVGNLPVYYSAGTLDTTIFPGDLKEEFAIPVEYEPGYYTYYCPKYLAGELQIKIYKARMYDYAGVTTEFFKEVNFPVIINAYVYLDLTPYCPALEA